MVALKIRYPCLFICLVPIFTLLLIQNNFSSKKASEKTYFDLDKLKNQVLKDASEEDILVNDDINVSAFLRDVEKDDIKWNISRHSDTEINDLFGPPAATRDKSTEKLKTILYWNEAYGSTQYGFCCGQDPFLEFQCPYTNCYATDNRSHLPIE